jgi:antitoxin (DNA-binding transcriptional repressor) of toxin-antitoxin stability system
MKHYSVTAARQQLAEALDAAEAGVPVVIERRGVRFRLAREQDRRPRRSTGRPLVEIVDPAVERGDWTWTLTRAGLRFSAGRPTSRRRTRR